MPDVPSAWDDDDWTGKEAPVAQSARDADLSRTERRAQHQSANRKLWEAAEAPGQRSYYLETQTSTPLESGFKPQVKVLSRKPLVNPSRVRAAAGGDDEDDSDTERRRQAERTLAERQRKAAEERADKQRRYTEARERIMGGAGAGAGAGVGGDAEPGGSSSRPSSRPSSSSRRNAPAASSSGGRVARGGRASNTSSAEQSPARTPTTSAAPTTSAKAVTASRQLYDPGYAPRGGSADHGRRDAGKPATRSDAQVVRMPRGPDASGRGGFAARGGRAS